MGFLHELESTVLELVESLGVCHWFKHHFLVLCHQKVVKLKIDLV